MADSSKPPTDSGPVPEPREVAPAAKRTPRWRARDLEAHASRWHTRPSLIQAAMAQAGTADVGSPEEAQALVEAYLSTPLSRTYP